MSDNSPEQRHGTTRMTFRLDKEVYREIEELSEDDKIASRSSFLRKAAEARLRQFNGDVDSVELTEERVDQLFTDIEKALLAGKKCLSDDDEGDARTCVERLTRAYRVLLTADPRYNNDHHNTPRPRDGGDDGD